MCFVGEVHLVRGIVHAVSTINSVTFSPIPHILPFHPRSCLEQNVEGRENGRSVLGENLLSGLSHLLPTLGRL